jgi:hypothetical protein
MLARMRAPAGMGYVAVLAAAVAPFFASRSARGETVESATKVNKAGVVIVSAARLIPLVALSDRSVDAAGTDGHTGTRLNFGSDPNGTNAYSVPRLGVDWVVVRGVTLGADFAGWATLGGPPALGDDPQVSLFGVAPRVGLLASLDPRVNVWLRAGVAYYSLHEDGVNGGAGGVTSYALTWKQLDLDSEIHLVFTPFPHLGVMAGIETEIPLHGVFDEQRSGATRAPIDAGASWLHLGLTAGLLGYL